MTGRRWQVRATIERMIMRDRPNKWRPGCDRRAWSRGLPCCAHHRGLRITAAAALGAVVAFTGGSSIADLIESGFSVKSIQHWARNVGFGDTDMMLHIEAKCAARAARPESPA